MDPKKNTDLSESYIHSTQPSPTFMIDVHMRLENGHSSGLIFTSITGVADSFTPSVDVDHFDSDPDKFRQIQSS